MNKIFFNCIAILILLGLLPVATTVKAQSTFSPVAEASSFTFADLGEVDMVVNLISEQETIHFPLAVGRQIEKATLKLHFSHNPNLLSDQSDFVIALNDEPVSNIIFTPENADNAVVDIDLPVEAFKPGDNILLFRFNLRLEENGCKDVGSKDLSATIFADSSVELNGSDSSASSDLSQFSTTFSTLSILPGNPQVSIILPEQPSQAELSAAAQVSAALGQLAQWKNPPLWSFPSDQLDQTRLANDHLIVIDTANRNPLAKLTKSGLTELISPFNANRLMVIVSGKDDAELLQSAAMLATRSAHGNLAGEHMDITQVPIQPITEIKPRAAFNEFGFETKRVEGIGLHDLYYGIEIPYDWKMTSEASIELHFRHGKNITSASLMSVLINGFEVSNVRLDDNNGDDGLLIIQLSPRQIRAGRNWMHIVFDLHMPRENCKYRYLDEAWAEIPADASLLNLAHVVSEPPVELSYLPSNMVIPTDLSGDMIVLPDSSTIGEYSAMVRIAAKLGAFSNADGMKLQAVTAGRFDVIAESDMDVIAIGSPESNSLLEKYDANLPQPLNIVGGTIVSAGNRQLLPEELSGQAGYIQVLYAPWTSSQNALIVLGARNTAQLYKVVDAFPTLGKRLKIQGNVAIVTNDQVTGFNFGTFNAGASLSPTTRIIAIIALIVTIVIMAVIGLTFARARRKKEKESTNEDE